MFLHCSTSRSVSGQTGGAGGAEQGAAAVQPAAVYPTDWCPSSSHPLTHGSSGAAGAVRTGPSAAGRLQ